MPKNELFVSGPGGKLHVYDSGSGGRAIIFIPSLGGTIRQWNAQIDQLAGKQASSRCS
jgi:hypothetical protein